MGFDFDSGRYEKNIDQMNKEIRQRNIWAREDYAAKQKQEAQANYTAQLQAMQNKQAAANKLRETEVRGMYDKIIAMYGPGGTFGQGMEAQIERQKKQSMAQGAQALVSAGLYGTTTTAGLGQKFEEEVGMSSRMKLEDIKTQSLAGAMGQKAQFITDISDQYPDYSMLAQSMAQGASA
jgi:hypothetical protein